MSKKILIIFLLFVIKVNAQVSSYSFIESTEIYTPVNGTNSSAVGKNGIQNNIPIGFTFNYSNVDYTTFSISTNGFIRLGYELPEGTSTATNNIKSSVLRPVIAPFWDANHRATGDIRYTTTGSAPNRVLEVGWNLVHIGGGTSSTTNVASFKLKLYETTNVIEFVYDDTMDAAGVLSASVGIIDEISFMSISPDIVSGASTLSANNAINTTTNLLGKKYSFAPPVTMCSGIPKVNAVSPKNIYACVGSVPLKIKAGGISSAVTNLRFQWEESFDQIIWNDVIGTAGYNSRILTPYIFDGTIRYYRLKVTCLTSGSFKYSQIATVQGAMIPTTQISNLMATVQNYSTVKLNWKNGNGYRRLIVISDSPDIIDPENGTNLPALVINNVYSGSGQQYVFDGATTSTLTTGLHCGTTYYAKAYEYQRCGDGTYDYYINTALSTNTVAFTISNPEAELPLNNDFNLFSGSNLNTVYPGWYESNIVTVAGTQPSSQNPLYSTSVWAKSNIFGFITAKCGLGSNTNNAWIITPKFTLTENCKMTYKAALTEYNAAGPDVSGGIVNTDDKINILISTDECGSVWEPLFSFNSDNADLLTDTLLDYEIDLSDYAGQKVQIAFQATDGPVNDVPIYDFHLTDINIYEVPPVVGLDDVTFNGFKYYPNPVSNVLNISNGQEFQSVVLYNILGQEVLNTTVNAAAINLDVSSLANGVYTVKVLSEGKQKNFKIIKK